MLKLYEKFYPSPLGRSTEGDIDQLKTLTPEKAKELVKEISSRREQFLQWRENTILTTVLRQLEKLFEAGEKKPLKTLQLEQRAKNIHIS